VFKIQELFGVYPYGKTNQSSHEACPAGLMACPDTGTIVAMEVFVEEDEVPPMRIGLAFSFAAAYGTSSVIGGILQEYGIKPSAQFSSDLVEGQHFARTGGTFDFEIIPRNRDKSAGRPEGSGNS
jgi:hypothetical protein